LCRFRQVNFSFHQLNIEGDFLFIDLEYRSGISAKTCQKLKNYFTFSEKIKGFSFLFKSVRAYKLHFKNEKVFLEIVIFFQKWLV